MCGRRRKWLVGGVLLLSLLLAGAYAARAAWLPGVARFLDVGDSVAKTDYAFVLGGGADHRPFAAAALYRKGLVGCVLVPRTQSSPSTEDGIVPPSHELVRQVLEHEGVPKESIVIMAMECASTRDEARALRSFLEGHPSAVVTAVTTWWHTRRARRVFRRGLGTASQRVRFLAVPTETFRPEDWWRTHAGVTACVSEYIKSCYYWFRY